MTKLMFRGGSVVNAESTVEADVLVEDGRIVAVGRDLAEVGATVVDASGAFLLPGLVDSHTHFDMPTSGTVTIDDFESGTLAALAGGTTCVVDFALQTEGSLLRGLDVWKQKAGGKAFVDYGFHLAVTDASDRAIEEMQELVDAGVPSLKVFMAFKGAFQADDGQLLRVLRRTRQTGGLVQVHAENGDAIELLIQERLASGQTAPHDHALARPALLEAEATRRGVELAKLAERPIFFVHVSCAKAANIIAEAQHHDLPVLGETCTHYLCLTLDKVFEPDFEGAKYVCSPPLRTEQDQSSLWTRLRHGSLGIVTTDHCAFSLEQKELGRADFSLMPNGLPTIQHRLALLYDRGVVAGRLSMNDVVRLAATAPARTFGLDHKGAIAPGMDADIVLFDPAGSTDLSAAQGHSRAGYSVFEGWRTRGEVRDVWVRGTRAFADGRPEVDPGHGRFVPRSLGPFGPGSMTKRVTTP